MTQYMLSVWHEDAVQLYDGGTGAYANEDEMQAAFAATDKFTNEIKDSGNFVFGGGLLSPTAATLVDNTGGDLIVTDGPFTESKENIGGFWVIEAKDLDEAMEIAARASKACIGKVEVRPFEGVV